MSHNEYYLEIFHEIKNSVALIDGYLQLLEKKYPFITEYDYWTASKNETSRLRTIVTEFSQLRFGSNLRLECVDLRTFVTDCCDNLYYLADKDAISCHFSTPEFPLMAFIDCRQLRHALINLVKNSCEAMHYHGIISVTIFQNATNACICITDLGGGIPASILEYIFDPFVTTKETGSGLGLNITKQIISAHNGNITVKSREGEGCTFTITLPLVQTFP